MITDHVPAVRVRHETLVRREARESKEVRDLLAGPCAAALLTTGVLICRRPCAARDYAVRVLDLSGLDLEEIATALADRADYEHRWLINPQTGKVACWTSDNTPSPTCRDPDSPVRRSFRLLSCKAGSIPRTPMLRPAPLAATEHRMCRSRGVPRFLRAR